jgi:aromatic-amino-acid transaminase
MFDLFPEPTADALHAVMARFRADPRPHKMDLGVGVYRDDSGASPVMRAVKEAEGALVRDQDTKAYQALAGDQVFIEAMTKLVFGDDHAAVRDGRIAAIQGTGGTGSLRIAMDVACAAKAGSTLHLGLPSWPNHAALAQAANLQLVTHDYFDITSQSLDFVAIEAAAGSVEAGDLFLFHGACHNPTGADLPPEERQHLLCLLTERGGIPLIDAAYSGLGTGWRRISISCAKRQRAFRALSLPSPAPRASACIGSEPASSLPSALTQRKPLESRGRWRRPAALWSLCPPRMARRQWRTSLPIRD